CTGTRIPTPRPYTVNLSDVEAEREDKLIHRFSPALSVHIWGPAPPPSSTAFRRRGHEVRREALSPQVGTQAAAPHARTGSFEQPRGSFGLVALWFDLV